jgi:hypothetical protein
MTELSGLGESNREHSFKRGQVTISMELRSFEIWTFGCLVVSASGLATSGHEACLVPLEPVGTFKPGLSFSVRDNMSSPESMSHHFWRDMPAA